MGVKFDFPTHANHHGMLQEKTCLHVRLFTVFAIEDDPGKRFYVLVDFIGTINELQKKGFPS